MIGGVSNNQTLFPFQLKKNVNQQNEILLRLASGRRINSGKDDPAGLISASQLEAAIASLEAESRAIERTSSNANVVDGQLTQLSTMMGDLRKLTVASANTGGLSDAEIDANQIQIDNLAASIHRFTQDAVSGLEGVSLPDGGNEQLAEQLRNADNMVATLASGGANDLRSGNFQEAQDAIAGATTAFTEARGTIGAYQRYNLDTRKNSLAVERENLASAHSRIMDADFAQETSNLARANVLTQTSVSVLRIANQSASLVLKLLG